MFSLDYITQPSVMLRHFWNAAIRNLKRNRLFTFINIAGLSVGIGVFLVLMSYVQHEFSYDKFFPGAERIYRLNYFEYNDNVPVLETSRTHDRAGLLMHEYVPQVEAVARFYHEKAYIFNEDVRIVDQDMLFADSSFFKVFPIRVLEGSAETALVPPNTVMISQSQAKAYFGDKNPLGKTMYFNEGLPIIVTGVFEDVPPTSTINFDFLVSWSTMWNYGWNTRDGSFDHPWAFTYVRLKEHASDLAQINQSLQKMAAEHITNLEHKGNSGRYELQPLLDLHTASPLSGELKPGTSKTLLYALISLAIFILVAAWINYINLSLAKSLERADEIGVRKVFGASKIYIAGQFLMEALLLSAITFLIGLGLYIAFTGPFAQLVFENATFVKFTPKRWITYLIAFVAFTGLAAFYPALMLARFKPVLILKNRLGSGKGNARTLQQGLMVFQMFLAVTIVGLTLIAGRQVKFIREFDPGFTSERTIALRGPASTNSDSLRHSRFTSFRNEVLQQAGIHSGSASMNIPGEEIRYHDEGIQSIGSDNTKKQPIRILWMDEGYLETFGLNLVAGRNFQADEPAQTCLINESAAKALSFTQPSDAVGTTLITSEQKKYTILGVVRDYHHQSLRKQIEPVLMIPHHPHEYGYYSFRAEGSTENTLAMLEQIWKRHYPHDAFAYHFVDEFYARQYSADKLFSRLLTLFSTVSIVVASLGLFGMASLSIVKRSKEIAVRKVLGASVSSIMTLISGQYAKLIIISCVFAFPTAYYITSQWLSGFSYRISVNWLMILAPGLIVLVAGMITIGAIIVRAAVTNPAKSLKEH